MNNITTIQLKKETLELLNRKKLNFEAKVGKRISMDQYVQELIK